VQHVKESLINEKYVLAEFITITTKLTT